MSKTDAGGVDKLSERKLSCRELARYIWDRAQNSPACFEQDIARLIENERKRAVERSTPVRCDGEPVATPKWPEDDDRPLPTYGQIPWRQLGRDVHDAIYARRTDLDFGDGYPGHKMLPKLNFNSLARIVDKYRYYGKPPVAALASPPPSGVREAFETILIHVTAPRRIADERLDNIEAICRKAPSQLPATDEAGSATWTWGDRLSDLPDMLERAKMLNSAEAMRKGIDEAIALVRRSQVPSADQLCPISGKPCDCIVPCSLPSTHRATGED